MPVWFEGQNEISCRLDHVEQAVADTGEYFTNVVRLMPGLTSVELIQAQGDVVTIKTNEGLMKRTSIFTRTRPDRLLIDFDEVYEAGSKITTNSHFSHQFVANDQGVTHLLVISDVTAPGLLGFFYRQFGSSKMGKAFLKAHKAQLEKSGS